MNQKGLKLCLGTLSPRLLDAEYAVRGQLLIKANEYAGQLKQGVDLPFDEIIFCNIGNPQRLDQAPISFVRNVLSLTSSPELLNHELVSDIFLPDEIERAQEIVDSTPGILGAYTHSKGLDFVRKHVAEFIAERDDVPEPDIENIFLSDGASAAIQHVMFSLVCCEEDTFMIPIPQYPLYTASISLFGGQSCGYYLDEETGWSVSREELERAYDSGVKNGQNIRSMVVINPGNPTGQVLEKGDMVDIVEFCAEKDLVLLADEVYQDNIYDDNITWTSFKKVVHELGEDYVEHFPLASFHSVSKGFLGECGRRGGYMELSNAFAGVIDELYKKASINLCPNLDGQIVVDTMINPPKPGEPSYDRYVCEKTAILESLGRRSKKLTSTLDQLEAVSCNASPGAMYIFPTIDIPQKAVEEASLLGIQPDLLYCLSLLDETGICVVPGSGFLQKEGTFHLRSTFLPNEEKMDEVIDMFENHHMGFLEKYQ